MDATTLTLDRAELEKLVDALDVHNSDLRELEHFEPALVSAARKVKAAYWSTLPYTEIVCEDCEEQSHIGKVKSRKNGWKETEYGWVCRPCKARRKVEEKNLRAQGFDGTPEIAKVVLTEEKASE